ncbi:MAG: peptide-methionine (S)-S-oxide reductase MsrA [Crocinitomicaceae bacterium]|nr:MAG: peptide-methionine (S)-S-oxide reductase MsrA [Crocinitomicaceae bacterium]
MKTIYSILCSALFLTVSLSSCASDVAELPKNDVKKGKVANDTITLGGGCYWCVEAVYERLDGVVDVYSGFSGGSIENPTYEQVCTGRTGHAEVVQIAFDSTLTSVKDILEVFFMVHDPTTLNKQGHDVGTQYRSVIFYHSDEQKAIAKEVIAALEKEKVFNAPIVTAVQPMTVFYEAEDYHQDYYEKNPDQSYCQLVVRPKVEKFEKVFGKHKESEKK